MKFFRLTSILLILTIAVQASPRHRNSHHRPNRGYHHSYHPYRYNNYYSAYGFYRYSTPVIVTTRATTTYPTNLVILTADSVAEDIVKLNAMMSRGLISEKDYERAKKTLLNRIGMSMNPDAQETTTAAILEQIETLYQMRSGQLLNEKEYQKQKKKLLALI